MTAARRSPMGMIGENGKLRNVAMPFRQIFTNFIIGVASNVASTLLFAVCVALGVGPEKWAAFLLAGIPFLISPGILRLAFLLLASLTLFTAHWRRINVFASTLPRNRALIVRSVTVLVFCLPFVFGSFYITAHSYDRHLSHAEKNRLWINISQIPPDKFHSILIASVDDPEAAQYASQFLYFLKYHKIPINEIYSDPPENTMLTPYNIREVGRTTGMVILIHDPDNPPDAAKLFRHAMDESGFHLEFKKYYGQIPNNNDFMLAILYNH
jgi:hypothetical protein